MICKVLGVSKVYQSKKGNGYFLKVALSYQNVDNDYVGEDVMSLFVSDSLKCFERFAANPQSCKGKSVSVDFIPDYNSAKLQNIEFVNIA